MDHQFSILVLTYNLYIPISHYLSLYEVYIPVPGASRIYPCYETQPWRCKTISVLGGILGPN